MKTYTTLYIGETRALSIYVRDQNDDDFIAVSASTYIKNSNDEIVVSETPAIVSAASVISLLDTVVTSAAGNYEVVWTLNKSGYVYKHVSFVKVVEL